MILQIILSIIFGIIFPVVCVAILALTEDGRILHASNPTLRAGFCIGGRYLIFLDFCQALRICYRMFD